MNNKLVPNNAQELWAWEVNVWWVVNAHLQLSVIWLGIFMLLARSRSLEIIMAVQTFMLHLSIFKLFTCIVGGILSAGLCTNRGWGRRLNGRANLRQKKSLEVTTALPKGSPASLHKNRVRKKCYSHREEQLLSHLLAASNGNCGTR